MSDKQAPQGVAEVMRLVDDHASSQIYSYSKRALVEQAITAVITDRDALRARVVELERDAARIDWLEAQINENGALHLHDGNDAYGLGLGLQTGRSIQSLRKAIDDASKEAK